MPEEKKPLTQTPWQQPTQKDADVNASKAATQDDSTKSITAQPNGADEEKSKEPDEEVKVDTTPSPSEKKSLNFDIALPWQKISTTQRLFLIQQMHIMVKAGVPITTTLSTLAEQADSKYFKSVLDDLNQEIEHGATLAKAMRKHIRDFGELTVNMIESGEVSGRLEEVLMQIYTQAKKDHEIVSKVRGALIYPAIVVTAMFGIGTFMIVFVIPKLTDIFKDAGQQLPLPTRVLISVSDFLVQNGLLSAIIFLTVIGLFVAFIKNKQGKRLWHKLLLQLPVVSPIMKNVNVARFCRTTSSFLKTDIPIVQTLNTTSRVLSNTAYKEALNDAAEKIVKGVPLAETLKPYGHLFNPTVLQMIAIGEQSGSLDTMLEEAANFYEAEVSQTMETLPTVLEPILMLMLGIGVGGMAVAIIQPLYSLTQAY